MLVDLVQLDRLVLIRADVVASGTDSARTRAAAGEKERRAEGRERLDAGDWPAATRVLNQLRQRMHDEAIAPAYIATILIGLGETDAAFVALGQADEQRSWYVSLWKVDPDLDPLRADPRFTALLKKAGFPP